MRRPLLFAALAVASALVAAPPAHAGGFATVGLSSTPAGVAPGQPWTVDITVLQHGRTPLEGITPRVRIESDGAREEFAARPTPKTGVYRVEVVFPAGGTWRYEVLDGFTDAMPHTFPAVRIGGAAPAAATTAPGGGIVTGWLWGAGAVLLLVAAVLLLDRRRHPPVRGRAPEPA